MKKGMKLIDFILAAVVTVSSVLPANVYANTNVDDNTYVEESILAKQTVSDSQLKSELAELYQKCLQNSGKTSFHGWCGAFVGQQLKALGIDSKTGNGFNGNGNTWYPCLLDNVETNSRHTQKKYAGRDCLKSIAADAGDEPAYNIVVSFPNSTGSNTSYGHVIFIYAIVGNTAYYIESYGTSFGAEGTPIARDIDGLMNEYCSLYGTAQGAVWFSGGGGISYINDDEMFSKYPYYLNDDTYNAMFRNARSEIYDALDNADSSRMLIAIMTALSEGKDLIIKQLLSSVTDGIDSTSDEAIDKATLDFVQTMLGNETFLSSFITSAQSKFKGIKLGYDLFSATGKEAFSKEASTLLGVHKEVFDLQLSKFLDNTGKVTKITKYGLDVSKVVASAVEMEYINIEVVEQLKTLLIQYGYDNTELYEGISRLDAKLHLDITTRVFDTVANDAVLDILSEVGDTVFNALVSEDMGIAYAIVNVVAKASVYFFYEKLGNGIKLDYLLETYALYEFQDTLFALKTDMYMELLSGKADLSSAAENYELIWNAYRAGIVSGLNSACEITKSKSLKSVRENMKEILTGTFTYDKFLERCRAAAMQAVVNGNAVTVGGSNTDSNAESKSEAIVEERLAKIIEMYPSGSSKFEMMYDNKKGSFAFTEFVFRTLYENIIDGTVASDKQYVYLRPYQTTRIGTLHGSEVSEDAIGILISKAKVGDVILGYGEKYGLHSMIFKEATDNGIVVYDSCWDKEKNGDYTVLLHEIPYTELAEWVGNGTSESEGGLSLYHFISYNSLYKRNSEIQADDKDNFIIDENGVLTGYKGYKTFVKIPDTVKAIGDNAFKNNDMIRNIYIPDSVTSIGENAFYDCDQLTSVFIPDSVTSVGSSCFRSCNNLTYAKLPQNMNVVSSNMFYECKKLETVVFGMNVTEIGYDAFYNCSQLKVDLPGNIKKIGEGTFRNCKSLTEITIPKSLTDCRYDIFSGCSNLKTIKFEKGITTIPESLFWGQSDDSWFDGLEEIDIPETVTTIEHFAFYNCKNLTTVTGMKNVTEIRDNAFYNCSNLKEIIIPDGVTSIGSNAFQNCTSLASVRIPNSVTSLGTYIFDGCSSLTDVALGKGLTSIPSYMFSNCESLKNIKIPYNVEAIESYAFLNDTAFTEITIPRKTTAINSNAFSYPGKLNIYGISGTYAETFANENNIKFTNRKVNASKVELNESQITLDSADNYQLSAYIYPSTASNKNVVWESSDPSVATVDDNGMVTALKKGTAKITVKAMDGSNVSASCTVTVKNTTYVCNTVDKIESQHNYENECSDSWIYTIEGAECIEVGFDERTAVESGFDYIYIFSADDTMVGQYTGTDLAGKTIRIEGSKVRIKLESDGSGNEWGFKVTSVKRASKSHVMELIPAKEATCIEEGNNSYYYCSECNKYFKDEAGTIETTISDEIIPAKKDHEYVNGYCKYCNKAQYEAGWKKTSTGWWYDNGDGTYPKNEWKYIDGKWYHFDERGYMQTGWKYIGSNWYFFNESGDMRTGWFTRYGKTYYCKPDGSMARQFVKVGSSTYYFDSEGALQTGWKQVGNKWYYMDSKGVVQTGWKQLGKNWYYLNSDGSMQTGWKQVGKNWYYMDNNGVMQTGWKYIGKNWYYMDSNGVMQTGWKTISGRRYYFYANGAMR